MYDVKICYFCLVYEYSSLIELCDIMVTVLKKFPFSLFPSFIRPPPPPPPKWQTKPQKAKK